MTDLPPQQDPSTEPKRTHKGLIATIIVLGVIVLALIIALIWMLVANGAPAPTPTKTPTATATTPSPTPTKSTPATPAIARCTVDDLSVTLGQPNGAAGSTIVPILFKNTSSSQCELHGFPGVSFVGDGNGTQLGAPADQDTAVAIQNNTLKPGDVVQAKLMISQAQNYDNCQAKAADGFRVYPPHSFDAVFVKAADQTACTNADVHLLTVQPVLPQ